MERDLKGNIDDMLDIIYGSTGAHPKTAASVQALLNQVKEMGRDIGRGKQHRKSTLTGSGNTQDTMCLD